LLGPNGAGKTTLLHLLAGVLAPDDGSIEVSGEADPTRAATRRKIGFAPQSTAVYDELTASENLVFFARIHGLSSRTLERSVDDALAFAALRDRRDHRVSTFSGGMKRRLHVAAALVHAPALILLDEPTVGVDAASRATLLDGVRALRERGCAVVYASHHLDEIERVCDRAVLLSRGRVVADDTVEKVAAAIDLESTLRRSES
jgi:ABC-2 type transport system ATP-binding protein